MSEYLGLSSIITILTLLGGIKGENELIDHQCEYCHPTIISELHSSPFLALLQHENLSRVAVVIDNVSTLLSLHRHTEVCRWIHQLGLLLSVLCVCLFVCLFVSGYVA